MIGDLPGLGTNSDMLKHPLKWTNGHIWVSTTPIRTSSALFRYNYIQIDERTNKKCDDDEGIKRIADLKSIVASGSTHNPSIANQGFSVNRQGNLLQVDIHDIWQTMRIKFTVMHTRIHHG